MAKTIKVDMNIGMPDLTIKKAKKAFAKHTFMGINSPLNGFVDMVDFNTKTGTAETLRKNAEDQSDLFQEKYQLATKLAGTGPGQNKETPGTIYFGVVQVRGILLVKHRGLEEALEGYGFNVVISQTGARRNVRVDIPDDSTPKMVELGQAIVEKHTALGVGSPLTGNIDMTAFGTLVADARAALDAWEAAKDEAQTQHNQALVIIGYGAGQTKDTPDTIYFDRISMRDRLLQFYQGTEESLTGFGFDVVISTRNAGGKKSSGSTVVVQIEVPMGLSGVIDLTEPQAQGKEVTLADFESIGSNGLYFAAATADGALPPAGPNMPVLNGQKLSRTPDQISSQTGLGEAMPFLKVQNNGSASGIYKVTFHFAA